MRGVPPAGDDVRTSEAALHDREDEELARLVADRFVARRLAGATVEEACAEVQDVLDRVARQTRDADLERRVLEQDVAGQLARAVQGIAP